MHAKGHGGIKLGIGCVGQLETEWERVGLAGLLISWVELKVSGHEQSMFTCYPHLGPEDSKHAEMKLRKPFVKNPNY